MNIVIYQRFCLTTGWVNKCFFIVTYRPESVKMRSWKAKALSIITSADASDLCDFNTEEKALDGSCCMMIRWFVNHLFGAIYALQQRQCMTGFSHFVTVKWSFQKSILIYFPALSFLCACVSLCTVMDRSGRYSMTPRGALPRSVSDESPGRWQGVITERKTQRYKKSKRDKEDWCLSSRHTCENMPMTLSPFGPLSFILSPLSYFLLSSSSLLLSSLHLWHLTLINPI